jgi:hypothetical protein
MSSSHSLSLSSTSAPARQSVDRSGFFAYHGIWSPGVRLFRSLQFASKAVIISLAFVVPLLGLLGWQLKSGADDAMLSRMNATRQHVEVAHGAEVGHAQVPRASSADRHSNRRAACWRHALQPTVAWSCTPSSPSSTARM